MSALGTRLTPLRTPTGRSSRARPLRGRGRAARPAPVRAAAPAQPGSASPVGGLVDKEPFSLGLRRDAEDALELGEPLGRGAMGVVRLATRKSDGCRFALKTIPKSGPASLEGQTPVGDAMSVWERKVRDEVNLHFALGASLDIVTLHDGFEDEAGVHLLIDLCDGGDLLTGAGEAHGVETPASDPFDDDDDDEDPECAGECWKPFSEATAAPMIRGMLRALAACHEHGVVHRDVKPANFLFMREPDGTRRLKLSDFGLAARLHAKDQKLTEQCGTYAYLSPEMARRRPYDFKVDAWAAGVVAYMLLAGEPPFADWDAIREGRAPTKDGLLRNVRRGRPDTPVDHLPLSPGARSLLSSLLTVDPDKRMSCAEAAEHYWVREKGVASHADALASTVVERLQAYGTLGAVRRASIRAAFEAASSGSFAADSDAAAATERLVRVVDEAAEEACANHDECDVGDAEDFKTGVSADALMLALRDHGAELAPEEWLSLIRPVAGRAASGAGGRGAFVDNAALAAILATPAGGSFSRHLETNGDDDSEDEDAIVSIPPEDASGSENNASSGEYDWNAIAEASFRRLLEKARSKPDADVFDQLEETVSFEDVADEVCAWDGSEELCRATLKEEFDAADADNDGKLGIMEWTDLVWSEGLMDGSGRVRSACGADAPAPNPSGPVPAGVGAPGCDLAPEESVRRPPTELSPREKARAAAEARRKMAAQRAAQRANRKG
jgi:serine/threonine protein kinase